MVTTRYKVRFNKDEFELTAWGNNQVICGIDEVGRGCLAGPVVVAAVILHPHQRSRLIKDSKLMTSQELLKGYAWIVKHSWYSIGIIHNRTIDKVNIYHATLKAMKRAFVQLMAQVPHKPHSIVVDAMPLILNNTAYQDIDVFHFPFGEKKSTSIAAASIVAKVTRDRLMCKFDAIIPGYFVAQHKGYSTVLHKKSIDQVGHSIIHRLSFLADETLVTENEYEEQQSLC